MNSKRKGNSAEIELLKVLHGNGISCTRNDQRYKGGYDNPDIAMDINGIHFHVEVKRCERLNIHTAMAQAMRDCCDRVPLVCHRRNYENWNVTIPLKDFIKILEE